MGEDSDVPFKFTGQIEKVVGVAKAKLSAADKCALKAADAKRRASE